MKRIILTIIVSVGIMIVIVGCSNKYEDNKAIQQQSKSLFPEYEYEAEKAQIQCSSRMAISSNGYYYTASHILYFYDIEHDLNIAMCSNAACSHNSENCAAYVKAIDASSKDLSCNCDGNEILYYNDKLYMVERNSDADYFLNQYDSNFNNKKSIAKIASFSQNETTFNSSVSSLVSENYFYYYTYSFDLDEIKKKNYEFTYNCMRVKLEVDSIPEKLGQFNFPGDYTNDIGSTGGLHILVSGDDIYYVAGGTKRMNTKDNAVQYRVAQYSKSGGDFNLVWTYTGNEKSDIWGSDTDVVNIIDNNACMDTEGNLYLLSGVENGVNNTNIIKINFKAKSSKKIYETTSSIKQMASDGRNLFIIDNQSAPNLSVLDTEGKIINTYKLDYAEKYEEIAKNQEGTKASDGIIIYGVDERYIMIGATTNAYKGLTSAGFGGKYEGRLSGEKIICGVGVIDKSKFLLGEAIEIRQIYQYGKLVE